MGRENEGCSVFIGNLSDHARNDDIERFFKGYGRVRDISLKGGYGKIHSENKQYHSSTAYIWTYT